MGQKINPYSFRLGVIKPWRSRWFFKGKFKKFLEEDEAIRRTIMKKASHAGIASVEIERTLGDIRIFIKTARPGFLIGRGGKGVEELTKAIEKEIKKLRGEEKISLSLNIEELKRSELSASYIAQQIAWDIEKRLPYRRVMKKYLEQIMQHKEAKGAKISVKGRLGGAEIARREWLRKGLLPLQKIRANIDYGQATAYTTYGTIGVKVWIYKGDIFDSE